MTFQWECPPPGVEPEGHGATDKTVPGPSRSTTTSSQKQSGSTRNTGNPTSGLKSVSNAADGL